MKFRTSDSRAHTQFDKAGVPIFTDTVSVHGFPVHYTQTGCDTLPTLFFVHGSPGSWDAFSQYMKDSALLAHYRMISVDRPGFGYSSFGDAKNLNGQSELLTPLLKRIQNGKAVYLIGHSLGGPLVVKLAADQPALCTGIVLLAASVDPAEEKPEKWRNILRKTPLLYLLPGAFKPSNEEIWYLKKDLVALAPQFANVTCEAWIIHGDNDSFVPVENAAYAARMLTNSKAVHITILKGASHFIPWDPWYTTIKEQLLQLQP